VQNQTTFSVCGNVFGDTNLVAVGKTGSISVTGSRLATPIDLATSLPEGGNRSSFRNSGAFCLVC
jgi:hypothetical protein